jgi:hypothetical protein
MQRKNKASILLAVTASVAIACILLFALRRPSSVKEDSRETTQSRSSMDFGTSPAPPTTEPDHDSELAGKVRAIGKENAKHAAVELKGTVIETEDHAALAIATSLASKLSPKDASDVLAEIIKKENAPPSAYSGLAKALKDMGRGSDAEQAYQNGIARFSSQFFLRSEYAKHLVKQQRSNEAVALCLNGIGQDGDSRSNSLRRVILAGEIQWEAGERENAKKTWKQLLEVAETLEDGKRYYEQVLARNTK